MIIVENLNNNNKRCAKDVTREVNKSDWQFRCKAVQCGAATRAFAGKSRETIAVSAGLPVFKPLHGEKGQVQRRVALYARCHN